MTIQDSTELLSKEDAVGLLAGMLEQSEGDKKVLLEALKRLMITGSAATGRMMCEFSDMHEYIERIMERPVFTSEMGDSAVATEIREKAVPDFKEAILAARAAIDQVEGSKRMAEQDGGKRG